MTSSFPASKAPGDNKLLVEVYQQYATLLLSQLLKVFNEAKDRNQLPISMSRACNSLLLKPNKPATEPVTMPFCSSNPISKYSLLAHRLNKVISSIIHPDQKGFMPNKSTDGYLLTCRLLLRTRVTKSCCLWMYIKPLTVWSGSYCGQSWPKFGFRDNFISWVRLLYYHPQGTKRDRQRCPLSPLLPGNPNIA